MLRLPDSSGALMNADINTIGAAFVLAVASSMAVVWLVDFFVDIAGRD